MPSNIVYSVEEHVQEMYRLVREYCLPSSSNSTSPGEAGLRDMCTGLGKGLLKGKPEVYLPYSPY